MNHHYWSAAPCNNELINDIDLVTWIFSLLLSFFCSHSVHLILNISPSKNVISNIKFTLKRQTVFRARARRKRRKRQRTISSPLNFCNIKAKTYSKKQQIKTNFKDTVSSRDAAVCVCVSVSVNYATAEKQFARKPRKFMLRLNEWNVGNVRWDVSNLSWNRRNGNGSLYRESSSQVVELPANIVDEYLIAH